MEMHTDESSGESGIVLEWPCDGGHYNLLSHWTGHHVVVHAERLNHSHGHRDFQHGLDGHHTQSEHKKIHIQIHIYSWSGDMHVYTHMSVYPSKRGKEIQQRMLYCPHIYIYMMLNERKMEKQWKWQKWKAVVIIILYYIIAPSTQMSNWYEMSFFFRLAHGKWI